MRAYRYATASLPHSRDGSSHDTHPLSWDTLNFWAILTQIAITMLLHSAYRFSTLATVHSAAGATIHGPFHGTVTFPHYCPLLDVALSVGTDCDCLLGRY